MKKIKMKAFLGLSFTALGIFLSSGVSAENWDPTASMIYATVQGARASYHPFKVIDGVSAQEVQVGDDSFEVLNSDPTQPMLTAANIQAALNYEALQNQGYEKFIAFNGIYGFGTEEQAGFVALRKKADGTANILVAYHGTKSAADAITDIWCGKQSIPFNEARGTGGYAHGGFLSAYMSSASAMQAAIARLVRENELSLKTTRLLITGHSLGGALATLAASDLDARGYPVQVVTYGSPRVFDHVAAKEYTERLGNQTIRFWGKDDLVSAVSPATLLGQKHVGLEFALPASGETLAAHQMKSYAQKIDPASVVEHVKMVNAHKVHRAKFEQDLSDLNLEAADVKKMRDAYKLMYEEEEKAVEKKRAQSFAHGAKNLGVTLAGVVKSAGKSIGSTVKSIGSSFMKSVGRFFSRS